jgi:predicted 3-demethylubiquinone-9 3-methyltransferase (glyoxalase superfamily)
MKKITPFLWFDNNLEEALAFYTSIFKDSKMGDITRLGDGNIMSARFELNGQDFVALNGGPHYKFTPAISFYVNCENQEEVDYYWNALSAGGAPLRCGWLTDRFGVTWQIIPSILGKLLYSDDAEKSKRVMNAMMQMVKLDISGLESA